MKKLLKKLAKWIVTHGLEEAEKELDRKRQSQPPPPEIPKQP